MSRPLKFCITWLIALASFVVFAAVINLMVDPYDVFGSPRLTGLNYFKPLAKNHTLLSKTYQVARVRPVTVLIGSSRVLIGLDSASSTWPQQMRPVYNYGVPGVGLAVSFKSLQEAYWAGRLRYAVVVLDFENFLGPEQPPGPEDESVRRFHLLDNGQPNPNRFAQLVEDAALSLFTIHALEDSIMTVVTQRRDPPFDLRLDGTATEAEFVWAQRADGARALFDQKEILVRRRASNAQHDLANFHSTPNLKEVARIVAFCRLHQIQLTLVLPPTHAEGSEIYWRAGLWSEVERWKESIASLVAQSGQGKVQLWDFDDFDRYATEPVPSADERSRTTMWFWEPSHFKKRLGQLLIERILSGYPKDLGTRLTAENVDDRNESVRQQHRAYVCEQKSDSASEGNERAAAICAAAPERDIQANRPAPAP